MIDNIENTFFCIAQLSVDGVWWWCIFGKNLCNLNQ